MTKFFDRFDMPITVNIDDLLPGRHATDLQKKRAVYEHYIRNISFSASDIALRPFREKARAGGLTGVGINELNIYFESVQRDTEKTVSSTEEVRAYSALKTLCMHTAQILFLDNSIKEGLKVNGLETLSHELSGHISSVAPKMNPSDVRFYAEMFLHQAAFDLIFVTNETPGTYDVNTGNYSRCKNYESSVAYLDLCAIKEYKASAIEKLLCQNITTNWCRNISRSAWDQLNACYYGGISATTGKPNLFATNYDRLLEHMLPQWPYGRSRFANTLLEDFGNKQLNIVELGAGSGAFTIDLFMATKRQKCSVETIFYLGLEPSSFMMEHFAANVSLKIGGDSLPTHWTIKKGTLEEFCSDNQRYVVKDAANVIVLSGTAHHIHHQSLQSFLSDETIKRHFDAIYVLDTTDRHGWTKPYYMWADCESPECFDNIDLSGIWKNETLWEEPHKSVSGAPGLTNAWIALRRLT